MVCSSGNLECGRYRGWVIDTQPFCCLMAFPLDNHAVLGLHCLRLYQSTEIFDLSPVQFLNAVMLAC